MHGSGSELRVWQLVPKGRIQVCEGIIIVLILNPKPLRVPSTRVGLLQRGSGHPLEDSYLGFSVRAHGRFCFLGCGLGVRVQRYGSREYASCSQKK